MSKIKIGLIGCGRRLRGVLQQLMKATDQVEVRALYDPHTESVKKTREQFNPDAHIYTDYRGVCADPDINWVLIGSWNCYHREHTIAAFEAGKHVFCEKPLATTVDDCLAMRDAWKKSGLLFSIGFTLRYSAHYRRIREIVSAGEVGRILSFEFNETLGFNHGGYIHADWRRKTEWAGTHLLEKCCHDIDLVNWIVDSTAVRAASFGGCDFFVPANRHYVDRIGPRKDGTEAFTAMMKGLKGKIKDNIWNPFNTDKDIVDNQVAIIQYASGARCTFHTNCLAGIPERRIYILGTDGAIRADVLTGAIEYQRIGFDTKIENRSTLASGGHGGGDSVLGQSLADSMLNGTTPFAGLEEGIRSAVTAFGIDEALSTGKVVDLNPLWKKAGIQTKDIPQ